MSRQENLDWLSESLDRFTIGIEYYDSGGTLQYVNEACLEIFGLASSGEVTGFKLFEDPNLPDDAKTQLLKGKSVNYGHYFDFEKVKRHGLYETSKLGRIYIDVVITPLRKSKNEITGYLVQVQDITGRKQAEKALQKSEERFRKIFEEGPLGMAVIDLNGRFLEINRLFCDMLGYTGQELVTLRLTDMIHPGDDVKDLQAARKLVNGELTSYKTETRFLKKNQDIMRGSLTLSVLRDEKGNPAHILTMIEDITDRWKAGKEMLKLSRAIEQSPSVVVITNQNGNIEYVNPAFTKNTGYTAGEVRGQNPRILKSGKTPPEEYSQMWKTITTGNVWHGNFINRKKNGDLVWERGAISPVKNPAGKITHFIKVAEDITERKQAEDAVDFLHSLLRHDMNNKITVIHGYLSLLEDSTLSSDQQERVSKAIRACTDGMELINKISSLLTIDQALMGETSKVDLVPVLEAVINTHTSRADDRGMRMELKPCSKKLAIQGGILIKELFSNLVENSIVHSEGTLLEIAVRTRGDCVVVTLEDDGKGIPDSYKDGIFRRGFKGAGSKGSGLGLFLVKTIAGAYGGSITVKDSALGGARFEVTLKKG
ncbi:MAG: PAS domain S-box protein [Candidatus Odinarchaeota archaeon]